MKLIAFDIDGTIALHNEKMEQRTKDLLIELEKRGNQILITSGKTVDYIAGFVRQIGLEKPIICGGNGSAARFNFTYPAIKEIFYKVTEEEKDLLYTIKEEVINNFSDSIWLQPNKYHLSIFHYEKEDTVKNLTKFIYQIFEDESVKESLQFYEHKNCIEVLPKNQSKGTLLKRLIEELGTESDNTIAVGDSVNDVSMFNVAETSLGINTPENITVDYRLKNIEEALLKIEEIDQVKVTL